VTNVYVMNADGSELRRLTRTPWSDSPVWSPAGRRIAFIRHLQYPPSNPAGDTTEVYVMNADETGKRRLTHNSWRERALDWSRTGKLALVRGPELDQGIRRTRSSS